ncbi:MAG TPA: DEAD/DEAH box helicase family protein [Methanothrix sp.]|nr:DEAD/DEAH box helicase family protein [Methanothrix sp.]
MTDPTDPSRKLDVNNTTIRATSATSNETSSATSPIINPAALEPLFSPHEEPYRYRAPAEKEGDPAKIELGRRPSNIPIAQNLRRFVKFWRRNDYPGASETSRELLHYWFDEEHTLQKINEGDETEQYPFRYYFCQREAIESLIYLYEIRGITTLSSLTAEFIRDDAYDAALGVSPKDDRWPKYAFKMATGSGKTKVMSLAIVWSYFHSLFEEGSTLARDFLVIAPNITVFERLKEDFADGKIFETDPLIPPAWRGDWNISVSLQDEAGGAATGGTLYLTNIHRLFDLSKRKGKKEVETHDWLGPAVSRARALDTGEALRERVTGHRRIMILNDEAHHLWDKDSAWNEAIEFVFEEIRKKNGGEGGIVAQLDFSATPKDNHGHVFQHVICDTPLGEAVDGGIVKIPVIGRGDGLVEHPSADAASRFQQHLMIGYRRWSLSREEWEKSGKKALLFIMTEDTEAADQIATELNNSPLYPELNDRTINLHTRLKGKIKWIGPKKDGIPVFEPSEKEISDEDLRELRRLSRELDSGTSPYRCIVSVLMLREGWDVKNVTTIVPLRPFTSKANILPEQTLGRGLRRMTFPGGPSEILTVIEHPVFISLYEQQLGEEGVYPTVTTVDDIPKITVSIFPDGDHKDLNSLDLILPSVSPSYTRIPKLDGLTVEDVKRQFSSLKPLELKEQCSDEIHYEGRHLLTNEIVEEMTVKLPLLESGIGAISFFRDELEHITGLHGLHASLAPLLEIFLTEILFGQRLSLFDQQLINRLGDRDVREHIRAVFVPLILSKSTIKLEQRALGQSRSAVTWKPYQANHSERHPAIEAAKTAFNLVPCANAFEKEMAQFLDRAPDVAAFCKNAGPEAVRIDYQTNTGRLANYTPDFLILLDDGRYIMLETKGRVDIDVPIKIRAAEAWCRAASTSSLPWSYAYVPQEIFEKIDNISLKSLISATEPAKNSLMGENVEAPLSLEKGNLEKLTTDEFISESDLNALSPKCKKGIQESIALFKFLESKSDVSFAAVFTPLLGPIDDAARTVIISALKESVPQEAARRERFFEPDLSMLSPRDRSFHERQGKNLRRTIIENDGVMPVGLLRWCLEYAKSPRTPPGGIFNAVKMKFAAEAKTSLPDSVEKVYSFRNEFIAHQEKDLLDPEQARQALKDWIDSLKENFAVSENTPQAEGA